MPNQTSRPVQLQAPAAPSTIATQVIEHLLHLACIVDRAVEDWGESFADGSCEVKFHNDEADKMEAILEFFDSLPDAPLEEGVIESGPLRAARVLRALAAPAAPAVDAWHPIETAPEKTALLLATEFGGPGDWRIKMGSFYDGGWHVWGASWTPTHWMHLPTAPLATQAANKKGNLS